MTVNRLGESFMAFIRFLVNMIVLLLFIGGPFIHLWAAYLGFDFFGIIVGLVILCIPFFSELFLIWYLIDGFGSLGHPFLMAIYIYIGLIVLFFILFALLKKED